MESNWVPLADLSPSLVGILGSEQPFPTTGGQTANAIWIQASDLQSLGSATRVVASVGSFECSEYLLQGNINGADELSATSNELGEAIDAQGRLYFGCVVPPGDGRSVPI